MRVGVDTSPLVQTRAGTARHVRGLLGALRGRPGLELELAVVRRAGPSLERRARCGLVPVRPRARVPARSTSCTARRSAARVAARVPIVLTVHDLAILRAPGGVPALAPPLRPRRSRRASCGRPTRSSPSRSSRRDETVELRRRSLRSGSASSRTASTPCSRPDGPRADGDYVLAVATLEPRKNLARAVEAARDAGVELRVVGARGWGGVDGRRLGRRDPGRGARGALPRRALRRSTRRCTRASACPCSRRWRAGRPS